jgi:Cysteine dioxygenase type I
MTALLSVSAAPSVRAARIAPPALTPLELVEYTRFLAAEVASGRYPYIDYNAERRWHQRIYRDRRVDVWLISWLPTQGTQLHDHGGSAGAFTVVSGELSEAVYVARPSARRGALSERTHPSGRSVGFDGRYIHDVRNTSDAPAVSVHAYSHPLTSMNYYDVSDGELTHIATQETDDPEADHGNA